MSTLPTTSVFAIYMPRLMQDLNLTDFQAAAVLGNAAWESSGFHDLVEGDNNNYNNSAVGIGWLQWTGGRHTTYMNYCSSRGLDWQSDEANYSYIVYEMLHGDYPSGGSEWGSGSLAGFRTTTTIDTTTGLNNAVWYIDKLYERPADALGHLLDRYNFAQTALDVYRGQSSLPDLDARNDSGFEATLNTSSVLQGTNVTLTYRLSNWGPGNNSGSTTGIYLSTNNVFDANDTLLTTDAVGALGAVVGSTETVSISTSNIAAGNYYIFAVADYNNAISETNETNNPSNGVALTVTAPSQQQPNLVANSVSLGTTSIVAGASTTVSYHIENKGTATAGASVSKIYLSTDSTITTSDTLLALMNDGTLQNGLYYSDSVNITLSSALSPGTYWIGVVADANGQVTESSESDNTSSPVQITVSTPNRPDLAIGALTVGASVVAGGTETISFNIVNSGSASASLTTTKLYLSNDAFIDANDILINTFSTAALSAGQVSSTVNTSTVIPSGLAPGTYNIIVQADSANVVTNETSETNNVFARSFTVTAPNERPIATINDHSLHTTTWAQISSWLSYSDANGDPATTYEFVDSGTVAGSGQFWTSSTGYVSPGVTLSVPAGNLGNVWVGGATNTGSETMWVRAFDGGSWSDWDSFTFTATPNHAPTATIADHSVALNQWTQVQNWLSYSDVDGNAATAYQFVDLGVAAGSGQFWTPAGGYQAAGPTLTVAAADLPNLWVGGATTASTDNMWVRAYDGHDWSSWDPFTLTARANTPPTLTVSDLSGYLFSPVALTSGLTYYDADGDLAVYADTS